MDEQGFAGREPAKEERTPGLSPVRAFLMLAAMVTIVPLTILATRPEAAPTTAPSPREPDFSLADAEAIAEFERLNDSLMRAYRDRNIALAESIFTSDSPMLPRVRKEIYDLINSSVISLTRFDPRSTQVESTSSDRIVIKRAETLYPRFETETGRDATAGSRPEERIVEWELRMNEGTWLLHEGVVVHRETLRREGER